MGAVGRGSAARFCPEVIVQHQFVFVFGEDQVDADRLSRQ